jgi:hypothetical protein
VLNDVNEGELVNSVQADRHDAVAARRNPVILILWRVIIAVLAWWGLLTALNGDISQLKYWSQISTLTVALTATAWIVTFAVRAPGWARFLAWCRSASTTYAIVTAVIYQTLLSGFLESTPSLLEHAVVPALAVLDWVLVGPGRTGHGGATRIVQPWWLPLTFLLVPLCYLGVYANTRTSSGRPLYPFLNPGAANFGEWVFILAVIFLAIGYLVWAVGRARSTAGRPRSTAGRTTPSWTRRRSRPPIDTAGQH